MTKIKVTKKKLSIDITKSSLSKKKKKKIEGRCNKTKIVKKIEDRYNKKPGCLEKN